MPIPLYQVDAFTDQPFAGNPAAVCLIPQPAQADWMQKVASEMNLSETAFLVRREDGYNLRWFTPTAEVALCGHATLASAHVLWESGLLPPGEMAHFHTQSGLLTAVPKDGLIEMDFPARPQEPAQVPGKLMQALGAKPVHIGKNIYDYLVEVEDEGTVREMKPDYALLKTLPVRGVIVTSRASTAGFDFVSRFFAPAVGVNEDPVTGSAHCCLAPYWAGKLGKRDMLGYQASPRGGIVHVCLAGDRVLISGKAITIFKATLYA